MKIQNAQPGSPVKKISKPSYVDIGDFRLGIAGVKGGAGFIEAKVIAIKLGRPLMTEDIEEITKDKAQYAQLYNLLKKFEWCWIGCDSDPISDMGYDANHVYRWSGLGPRILTCNYMGEYELDLVSLMQEPDPARAVVFVDSMTNKLQSKDYSKENNSILRLDDPEAKKALLRKWWTSVPKA